jgi:hypothetical protein
VRLTVGALIKQATGEDWTDARVMLSTARPKLDAEAPIPGPWRCTDPRRTAAR